MLQDVTSCEGGLDPAKVAVLGGTAVGHGARQWSVLLSSGFELGHLLE